MESYAKQEYDKNIEELRNNGISNEDLKVYEKSLLIKKSVEEVQKRAIEQKVVRTSPQRYKNVKSKVARCLKVKDKVIRN